MSTQVKFNIAVAALILGLFGFLVWSDTNRAKQDDEVYKAAMRAERAVAVFRSDSARITPEIIRINKQLAELQTQQTAIQVKILLNQKRNEALNKNLDSVNGKLGIRPRF